MQPQQQNSSKKSSNKSIIGGAVALWLLNPVLLSLAGMIYGVYLLIRQITQAAPPARQQQSFDICPTGLFCFHRDKGEHHVRHGREMDPWDRPDIDISRYQRRH